MPETVAKPQDFWIVCRDYHRGPFKTEAQARAALGQQDVANAKRKFACHLHHVVVPTERGAEPPFSVRPR